LFLIFKRKIFSEIIQFILRTFTLLLTSLLLILLTSLVAMWYGTAHLSSLAFKP
jgi:hypothetical protein